MKYRKHPQNQLQLVQDTVIVCKFECPWNNRSACTFKFRIPVNIGMLEVIDCEKRKLSKHVKPVY